MNYFLMLLVIALGSGGYYEYTILQAQIAGDKQQISDLQAKLDPLTADDQKLTTENAELKKSAAAAQAEVATLTQQVQTAQTALAQATAAATSQASAAKAAATAQTQAPPSITNLGNITTLDGKSYLNCTLLKVQPDSIVVNHSAGITQVAYGLMPPDLQKRFGYDPHVAPSLTDEQVEALEAKRKAASP